MESLTFWCVGSIFIAPIFLILLCISLVKRKISSIWSNVYISSLIGFICTAPFALWALWALRGLSSHVIQW